MLLACALTACAPRTVRQPSPPPVPSPPEVVSPPVTREGRAFQVVPGESLLTVRVYRGGPLAKAGHNHVIASRTLAGTVWVPQDLSRTSFEIRIPVAELTIDEVALRTDAGPQFATEVSDSAREGTRRNMLGEAMLDAARFPEIVLSAREARTSAGGEPALVPVSVSVRDQTHVVTVPVLYTLSENEVSARGELRLKQTEIGLTPFSLLGGALRVEDEMVVTFSVRARAE